MQWVLVVLIGAIVGALFSWIARIQRMPQWLNMVIGIVGALGGAAIFQVSGFDTLGNTGFYAMAGISAFLLCSGGLWTYMITRDERRV